MRYLCVFTILLFLVACSDNNMNIDSEINIIFESEGKHWKATVLNDVVERNGRKLFKIIYEYKGELTDLNKIEKIVFFQGTILGTQGVNVYDPTHKQKLIEKAGYQEEYDEYYGIIIDDIKRRETNEFVIEYDILEFDNGYSTLDAIADRISIIIAWEKNGIRYEDKISSSSH